MLFVALPLYACSQSSVKIAGHRGGYYFRYPESSISLFEFIANRFKQDTVIIEIDLRKSKDGTLYLMHDETVDRTTTGTGKINELTNDYLNSLRLKTKSGKSTSQTIPTFEEILNLIKNRNLNLMLDIKEPIHLEVLEQVKNHQLDNRVLVLTFRSEHTQLVAEQNPAIFLSALIESDSDLNFFKQLPVRPGKRIAYINAKTPASLITQMRDEKIMIMADVSEDLRNAGKPLSGEGYRRKVQEQKLDLLICDFPIEARRALNR